MALDESVQLGLGRRQLLEVEGLLVELRTRVQLELLLLRGENGVLLGRLRRRRLRLLLVLEVEALEVAVVPHRDLVLQHSELKRYP